jgi:hypothetical protein
MDLVTHDPVAINVISLGINDSNEKDLRQATDENYKCVQECEVRVGECGDGLLSGISWSVIDRGHGAYLSSLVSTPSLSPHGYPPECCSLKIFSREIQRCCVPITRPRY